MTFAAALRGVRLAPCPLVTARGDLPADDRPELDAALADVGVSSAAISTALAALNVRVAASDIRNHRAGDCPCLEGA